MLELRLVMRRSSMKSYVTRPMTAAALSAAVMSVLCALFEPYGYPWASLTWAVLACAAIFRVAISANLPTRSMSEVIRAVESESPRATVGSK